MGVVARQALRRWAVVAAAVAVAFSVPPLLSAVPARGSPLGAGELRQRVLDSAARPYQGYAESTGRLGIPDLPQLSDVTTLLNSTIHLRAWHAGPDLWRVDQIGPTGTERDVYRVWRGVEYVWDYGADSLTQILGEPPLRLPRVADLVPPELARRLLSIASADPVARLPSRRVAGVDAAGLRLVPADPQTTIGTVDVWADPVTGLAVQVEVTGRGAGSPVLTSRFLDLSQRAPDPAPLVPHLPAGASFQATDNPDLASAVSTFGLGVLPQTLAGRPRRPLPEGFEAVGVYGSGLSAFAVLPLPRGLGGAALAGLRDAGGAPVALPGGGTGIAFGTPLVSVLVARFQNFRRTYLLAGLDSPQLLRDAVTELAGRIRLRPP
jgi:hypothetical protein